MKTAGTIVVVALGVVAAASPALAGKKKSKKKAAAAAAAIEEPRRRLCDAPGLGYALAKPSGSSDEKPLVDDGAAVARADSFDLSRLDDRSSTSPTGEAEIRMEAIALTEAQVGQVVKGRRGEVQYCWSRLPAAQRIAGSYELQLTVEARGTVAAVTLGGDAPAALARCVESAAKRWTFPVVDTRSEIAYPISLK